MLVDPAYELKSDFEAAAGFVRRLVAKWPEAAVLVWYPILPAGRHRALLAGLAPLRPLVDEAAFAPPPARGMTGSGLALVNAPFGSGGPRRRPQPGGAGPRRQSAHPFVTARLSLTCGSFA